jgi:hypothetical protein
MHDKKNKLHTRQLMQQYYGLLSWKVLYKTLYKSRNQRDILYGPTFFNTFIPSIVVQCLLISTIPQGVWFTHYKWLEHSREEDMYLNTVPVLKQGSSFW